MIARWCSELTVACVLSAAFLAGCSSTATRATGNANTVTPAASSAAVPAASSTAAPAASSTSAVCKSAQNLKSSITGLKDVNIRAGGTSAVTAQVTKINQDLETLKSDAKGEFSTQVTDLSNALNKLTSSLDAAKASLNAGTISALASAAGSVVTAGTNLVSAVDAKC